MFRNLIISALCAVVCSVVYSQQQVYQQFNTSNGLSSSQVHDIIQDDWGFLWFSTDNGLNRYDGYGFDLYDKSDGLTDNTVFNFFKHENGEIWVSSFDSRMNIISGRDGSIRPYEFNEVLREESKQRVIQSVHFGLDDNVYFTFLNSFGYLKIDKNGQTTNLISSRTEDDAKVIMTYSDRGSLVYSNNSIDRGDWNESYSHISVDRPPKQYLVGKQGALMIEEDVFFFIVENQLVYKTPEEEVWYEIGFESLHIGRLNEHEFWVSTMDGGVFVYDLKGVLKRHYLPGQAVTMAYTDHEGSIWLSTLFNGVYKVKNPALRVVDDARLSTGIQQLQADSEGKLWMSTRTGDVLASDGAAIQMVKKSRIARPSHLFAGKDRMWYISSRYLYNSENNDSTYTPSSVGFEILDNDSVLVHGYGGLMTVVNEEPVFVNNGRWGHRVNDRIEFQGAQLIASKTGLLTQLSDTVGFYDMKGETIEERVSDLDFFNDHLVIATHGKGAFFYNGNRFLRMHSGDGLSSNIIRKIYKEDDRTLWLCTNQGLNRVQWYNDGHFEIKKLTVDDGLVSNEVTDICILKDTLWIGTRSGLNYIRLGEVDRDPLEFDYHLSIPEISINDGEFENQNDLSYQQNRLEFSFLGISFDHSEPLTYRYKIEGLESNWNYTRNTSIVYPSLPPGDYNFLVQLKGKNASWELQTQSFAFIINPPYWQTWWFILSMITFGLLLIYLFFRFRILIYNGDLVREILRQILKRIRNERQHIIVRESGKDVKIFTDEIQFIKSDGNYLEIHTDNGKHLIREKIGNFLDLVPDRIEFLQIRRSYIVRIDKVTQKSKKSVFVGNQELTVGKTFLSQLDKIKL